MPGSALQPSAACAERPPFSSARSVGDGFFAWRAPAGRPEALYLVFGRTADDPRMAGRGLLGYFELTGRAEALDSAVRLADNYLRPHRPGSADGRFVEWLRITGPPAGL